MKTSAEVKTQIDNFDKRYAELSEERSRVALEISAATTEASQRYLETGDIGAAKKISELEIKADMIANALGLLTKQKAIAERDLKAATASELRKQASDLRDRAEGIEKKCEKPLAELSRLQAINYTRAILEASRTGTWITTQAGYREPSPFDSPADAIPDPGVRDGKYSISLAKQLLAQAAELDYQAEEIERSLMPLETEWKESA